MTDHPNSMNPRGGPPGRDLFTLNGGPTWLIHRTPQLHRKFPRLSRRTRPPNITDMLADVETEICDIRSHAELVRLAGVALFTENDEEVGTAIEQLGHDLRDTNVAFALASDSGIPLSDFLPSSRWRKLAALFDSCSLRRGVTLATEPIDIENFGQGGRSCARPMQRDYCSLLSPAWLLHHSAPWPLTYEPKSFGSARRS
jgi:hypothetical protein